MAQFMPTSGQPFGVEQNKVRATVAHTWTAFADDENGKDRAIAVHGVLWSGSADGATLLLRDREGDIWFQHVQATTPFVIDEFTSIRPIYTQFEYWDSTGSNTIIIYGTYI